MKPLNGRTSKQRERVDFKFSNFQALQVPKGWDRLFVLIVSAETGKTIAKLGRGLVRNGSCQWTETVSECLWISRDESTKEFEECLVKFILCMGSTRSTILGEAIIDVAQYTSSKASSSVLQPLKKGNCGTLFQVKVQCLTPKPKIRDDEKGSLSSQEKDQDVNHNDTGSKSNGSDHPSDSGPHTQDLPSPSHPLDSDSKETSETTSGPYNSFESIESTEEKETFLSTMNSPNNEEFSGNNGRPVEENSENESALNQSSLDSRLSFGENSSNEASTIRPSVGSSRNLLEAAADAIEELRAEAKMWERNANKLMIDLDMSRKESSDLSKKQSEIEIELSASHAERDLLKREVEKLKEEMKGILEKQDEQKDSSIVQSKRLEIQKALESEIKYQQDMNAGLGLQLKQSQESNIELVSILQELEEKIEQQKLEIENLSSLKIEFTALEGSVSKNSEENWSLMLQLEQIQQSEKKLRDEVRLLEETLREKNDKFKNERKSNCELLSREKDYEEKMSLQKEEIARLQENLKEGQFEASNEKNERDFVREIEFLKGKIQELEKDCTELTDENLELLYKLKGMNKAEIRKSRSFDSMSSEHPNVSPSDDSEVSDPKEDELEKNVEKAGFENSEGILEQFRKAFCFLDKPWSSEISDGFKHEMMDERKEVSSEYILSYMIELNKLLETRISECEEILGRHQIEIDERNVAIADAEKIMEGYVMEIQENEKSKRKMTENYENLVKELDGRISELSYTEEENACLLQHQKELEAEIENLQQEKINLEQNLELLLMEKSIASESLENLQNDLVVLRNTVDLHISSKTILERKLEELETRRNELEENVSGLEEESVRFQECIVSLEDQVKQLKDEKDFFIKEMDESKSVATALQKQVDEMDMQLFDLKQKSENMEKQWLEARYTSEFLKEENQILEESAANLSKDRIKLEESISELKKENQVLHDHCSELMDQLTMSEKSLSFFEEKVEFLEDHLNSVINDSSMREKNLKSEIDGLFRAKKEKFDAEESLQQVNIKELERLREEVERLTREISVVHEEKERNSFEAQSKRDEFRLESESKVRDLSEKLAVSQENHAILMADHKRLKKLSATYKKNEDKLKTDVNDLELKLTMSDYECQQLTKEMGMLKVELQTISGLQDEISGLKDEIKECRVEKERIELALQMVSGDYEELKAEKGLLSEKISSLQNVVSEFEGYKRRNSSLEKKTLDMENELSVKEILDTENNELRNELAEVKRSSVEFQQKIYRLEGEKDECLKKIQEFQRNLHLMEERYNSQTEASQNYGFHVESPQDISSDHMTRVSESSDANEKQRISGVTSSQSNRARDRYERSKSSLESELKDLRERYLEISLKYAEVAAEREDLVMKLKATRPGKKWFS